MTAAVDVMYNVIEEIGGNDVLLPTVQRPTATLTRSTDKDNT
jgi:hypothetical protein